MSCKRCETKPVFVLTSGGKRCRSCFLKYFDKKARKTIRQYNLIESKDKVAVALSGGKDSISLLDVLYNLKKKNRNFELVAILIDEGIKGYRPVTIKNAKAFCKEKKIPLHIVSFREELGLTLDQMVKKLNLGPCSMCGTFRRYLLNKKARELKATKLATGHNCDDEAQSIVMNLFRNNNEASARLGPKTGVVRDSRFIIRIKPFYFMLEKEVKAYAHLSQLIDTFVECPYTNLSYRGQVRDMLNQFESKYPGTKSGAIASFLDTLPLLKKKHSEGSIKHCKSCGEPCAKGICKACALIRQLNELPLSHQQ